MKKVLIVIATIVLMCSMLALTTFADGTTSSPIGPNPIDLNNVTSSQAQNIANQTQQLTQGTNLGSTGNKILDSDLGKSFIQFLQDATFVITIALPIICGLFGAYYSGRMSMSDEQDHPRWKKRIIICLVVAVVGASISGLIALGLSYVPKS